MTSWQDIVDDLVTGKPVTLLEGYAEHSRNPFIEIVGAGGRVLLCNLTTRPHWCFFTVPPAGLSESADLVSLDELPGILNKLLNLRTTLLKEHERLSFFSYPYPRNVEERLTAIEKALRNMDQHVNRT